MQNISHILKRFPKFELLNYLTLDTYFKSFEVIHPSVEEYSKSRGIVVVDTGL